MDDHNELMERLAALDPTHDDLPPSVGSATYLAIQEQAMKTLEANETTPRESATDQTQEHGRQPANRPGSRSTFRHNRGSFLVAAAAVTVLVALGAVLLPGGTPSAEAAILSAAQTTGDAVSFRATLVTEAEGQTTTDATGTFVGNDVHIIDRDSEYMIIGDTAWQRDSDGSVNSGPVGDNDRLASFSSSSEAVISAVLEGSDVADLGSDTVAGITATHYAITPGDASRAALTALSPGELAWFELEYPDGVQTIDVWIADDLIHQIRVDQVFGEGADAQRETTTTTFFDFGADLTITPLS